MDEEFQVIDAQKFELARVKDAALRAKRKANLEKLLAPMEEEYNLLSSEIARLEQALAADDDIDREALMGRFLKDWRAQSREDVIQANYALRSMLSWVGVLTDPRRREVLVAVEWGHGERSYLLSWRNVRVDYAFTPADDAWLRKNYGRSDRAILADMDKRFWKKGVTMNQVMRHAVGVLGLSRSDQRGKKAGGKTISLDKEWERLYQYPLRQSGILYGVLDRHPLESPRKTLTMEAFSQDEASLGSVPVPREVAASLRALVRAHAGDLP